MTIYSYLRVSTNQQSVDMQREAIARKGIIIEDGHEYTDCGLSGSLPALERQGFSSLYDVLQQGDTVYIYSLSRLGRNTANVLSTVDALDCKGVSIIFIADGIITGGATGRLMLTMLAAFATFERDVMLERQAAGFAKEGMREKLLSRVGSVQKKGLLEDVEALHKQYGKLSINATKAALDSLGHECSRAAVANYIRQLYS